MKTYTFISDPGHGWLRVPLADLDASGVKDQITEFSFISADGQTALLEEDCDAPTFLTALSERPIIKNVFLDDFFVRPQRRFPA